MFTFNQLNSARLSVYTFLTISIMLICAGCIGESEIPPTPLTKSIETLSGSSKSYPVLSTKQITKTVQASLNALPLPTARPTPVPTQSPFDSFPYPFPTAYIATTVQSPNPEPTALPEPTPTQHLSVSIESYVPIESIESRPDCNQNDTFWDCHDEILGVEFTYPDRWGLLSASLTNGSCGGFTYNYTFDNRHEAPDAGGLSYDYCKPIGGHITSFRGFHSKDNSSAAETCAKHIYNAVSCVQINENVFLAIHVPTTKTMCSHGPSFISQPVAKIYIHFPISHQVSGFIFISNFLSNKLGDQWYKPFGGAGSYYPNGCGEEVDIQAFEDIRATIVEQILSETLDEETTYNIGLFTTFATSIKGTQ